MSDDTAAIAAYGTWTGESTEQVLADWVLLPGSGRAQWRAIADAAITAARLRQPAELAAVMAETRELRKVVSEFVSMFRGISGGWGARTSGGRIDRLAKAAGVPGLSPGQPGEPDELAAVTAEHGKYRDALDQVAKHVDDPEARVRVLAKIARRALGGRQVIEPTPDSARDEISALGNERGKYRDVLRRLADEDACLGIETGDE